MRTVRGSYKGAVVAAAVFFLTRAPIAYAGNNVWTSNGPGSLYIHALAIDPVTPVTLYAGGVGGVQEHGRRR